MKILVLGGTGKIGSAVVWDLSRDKDVEEIGIVGRKKDAKDKKKRISSSKVVAHYLDLQNRGEVKNLMKKYDSAVIALPDRNTSYSAIDMAFSVGLDVVDVLEEYHRRPDHYETEGLKIPKGMVPSRYGEYLHKKAIENDATLIDGMGFAPGLSNVTLGEGIRKLDKVKSAIARVGGIPSKKSAEKHPLKYMITWAFGHVLREYMVRVKVMKNGRISEVDAMTDYEKFTFSKLNKHEDMECFVTPGMPSFIYTRPNLREFSEKTIRWPGHWQGIQTLKECGLLDTDKINFKGVKISPRNFLQHVIQEKLNPSKSDSDICVMWNTVIGEKNGRKKRLDYYMWEKADLKNRISAMARVTGFPAAIAAKFLANGLIEERGIVPPEDCMKGETYMHFMRELDKRKVRILETQNYF